MLSCGLRVHSPSARCGGNTGRKSPRSEPTTVALPLVPPRPPNPEALLRRLWFPPGDFFIPAKGPLPGRWLPSPWQPRSVAVASFRMGR